MTERRQQGCDVANRSGDLGIDRVAIRRFVGEGDAQPAGVAPSLLRVSPRWRRRDVEARRFRPVDRIQHDGTVAHADADHMTNGKSAPAFATVAAELLPKMATPVARKRRARVLVWSATLSL